MIIEEKRQKIIKETYRKEVIELLKTSKIIYSTRKKESRDSSSLLTENFNNSLHLLEKTFRKKYTQQKRSTPFILKKYS